MRKHRVSEKKSDNILYLKLEQMVYEYEETLKIISAFNFSKNEIQYCFNLFRFKYKF